MSERVRGVVSRGYMSIREEVVLKISQLVDEEAKTSQLYERLAEELRDLGFPHLADKMRETADDERRHMALFRDIVHQMTGGI